MNAPATAAVLPLVLSPVNCENVGSAFGHVEAIGMIPSPLLEGIVRLGVMAMKNSDHEDISSD